MFIMTSTSLIKEVYEKEFKELLRKGKLPIFDTQKGVFGPSHLDDTNEVFNDLNLKQFKSFLDLGSGDGRITLLASLYTKASGVEHDKDLHERSIYLMKNLRLRANFIRDDFLKIDLSKYDVLFIHPDKPFKEGLGKKIRTEFKGLLIVYSALYLPLHFKLKKSYDFPGERIFVYDCR
jgi:16S rRNA G1207 methylase RsmC